MIFLDWGPRSHGRFCFCDDGLAQLPPPLLFHEGAALGVGLLGKEDPSTALALQILLAELLGRLSTQLLQAFVHLQVSDRGLGRLRHLRHVYPPFRESA